MTGRRTRPALAALVVALVLAVVAPGAGLVAPTAVRGADPGLTVVTDATYTVRPEAGDVGVAVAITARNRTSETRTRRFLLRPHLPRGPARGDQPADLGSQGGPRQGSPEDRGGDAPADRFRVTPVQRKERGDEAQLRPARAGRGQPAGPRGKWPRHAARLGLRVRWCPRELGHGAVPPAGVSVESASFPAPAPAPMEGPFSRPGACRAARFFAFVSAQLPAAYVDRPLSVPLAGQAVDLLLQDGRTIRSGRTGPARCSRRRFPSCAVTSGCRGWWRNRW